MGTDKITVLLVQPGRYPKRITVENSLECLQAMVGGYIEPVHPWTDNACILCDDEAKLKHKPLNRSLDDYEKLAGDFVICGLGEEGFCNLTHEQMVHYERMFHDPQLFFITPSCGITNLPCTPARYDRIMGAPNTQVYHKDREER